MGRTLVLITGASKGFGKAITSSIINSSICSPTNQIDLLLTSRDFNALKTTTDQLTNIKQNIKKITHQADFTTPDPEKTITSLLDCIDKNTHYDTTYLINNAGSLGVLKRTLDLDYKSIHESIQLNVIVPYTLTISFMKRFLESKMTIVNVSSLAAIEPFDCWGIYCTGKAARNMFHKEATCQNNETKTKDHDINNQEISKTGVRVLNYAPGPLDTNMQHQIRNDMPHVELRDVFERMYLNNGLVSPLDSSRVLVDLLEKDTFVNGSHIDYYDSI